MADTLRAEACAALSGHLAVPGDKSISHRAIILGSLAQGTTRVAGLLEGEDVLCTIAAFRAMGVEIVREEGGWRLEGVGVDGLSEPDNVLDMGNSGTAMRLISGVLASQSFLSILTGDESLRRRPMGRVVEPLTRMGAKILGREKGRFAPLVIQGTELLPFTWQSPHASAQVKSALLLAGLNTPGDVTVVEPALTRDHTERMLAAFGAVVHRQGLQVTVEGWASMTGMDLVVPGDISSAAFPMVAALLVPGSEILIQGVGVNPTRTGLLDLLTAMGARIELHHAREVGGEPVADLLVRHSPLKGITTPMEVAPRAIDEFPIFFVAAAFAEGETLVRGAGELRVKESDRIAAMAEGLRRIGVEVEEFPDGMRIVGMGQRVPGGAVVDSFTDHRVAMSFLVAGLAAEKPITVTHCANIATSFPGFVPLMTGIGARIDAGSPS